MSTLDLAKLEEVARAVGHQAWHREGYYVFPPGYQSNPICVVSRYLGEPQETISAKAEFIATFDPPTVLRLIEAARAPPSASPESLGVSQEDPQLLELRRELEEALAALCDRE